MKKSKLFPRRTRLRSPGFSLIEILIVIALIGTLAGLMIANLDRFFSAGKEDAAKIFVNQAVKTPLQMYSMHMNGYPTSEQGLKALSTPPAGAGSRWRGPYFEDGKEPTDPWGQPYQYASPGTKSGKSYDIWSMGPDKKNGGGDDIGNW